MADNKHSYVFVIGDESCYVTEPVNSLHDAIAHLAKYEYGSEEPIKKCLVGFADDEVEQMIRLYNKICYGTVIGVYELSRTLYEKE